MATRLGADIRAGGKPVLSGDERHGWLPLVAIVAFTLSTDAESALDHASLDHASFVRARLEDASLKGGDRGREAPPEPKL